jgi:hypothetical protein
MLVTRVLEHPLLVELLESHRAWDRWELVVVVRNQHRNKLLDLRF